MPGTRSSRKYSRKPRLSKKTNRKTKKNPKSNKKLSSKQRAGGQQLSKEISITGLEEYEAYRPTRNETKREFNETVEDLLLKRDSDTFAIFKDVNILYDKGKVFTDDGKEITKSKSVEEMAELQKQGISVSSGDLNYLVTFLINYNNKIHKFYIIYEVKNSDDGLIIYYYLKDKNGKTLAQSTNVFELLPYQDNNNNTVISQDLYNKLTSLEYPE